MVSRQIAGRGIHDPKVLAAAADAKAPIPKRSALAKTPGEWMVRKLTEALTRGIRTLGRIGRTITGGW